MELKQKLEDLKLKLQGERKTKVILGFLALFLLSAWLMGGSTDARRRMPKAQQEKNAPSLRAEEGYNDLVASLKPDLDQLRAENQQIRSDLKDQKISMREYEERTAEIFRKLLEKMSDQESRSSVSDVPMPSSLDGGVQPVVLDEGNSFNEQELESFGLEPTEILPPPPAGPEKVAFIGAGDSLRIKLLAGVNAPTDGTPYPVVFKAITDVDGPDGSTLPLGEARIIAAAQGSLTDSRALFRLTSMNIRLPNGRRIVKSVDGWVVGEDGVRGMPGILIDPIGKAIAGSMMAGTIRGLGSGLEARNTTVESGGFLGLGTSVSVTGNPYEYAAGRGIREGAGEWSSIIRERLNELVPVVQVLSNREGTAVFAKSVSIKGLYEELEGGYDEASIGLD